MGLRKIPRSTVTVQFYVKKKSYIQFILCSFFNYKTKINIWFYKFLIKRYNLNITVRLKLYENKFTFTSCTRM